LAGVENSQCIVHRVFIRGSISDFFQCPLSWPNLARSHGPSNLREL
jgi:hypothetical protein